MDSQLPSEERFSCRWRDCPGNHHSAWDECAETTETCESCGGQKKWCSTCLVYTKTCCVEYGTCQCS
jgi:hypothetical protein